MNKPICYTLAKLLKEKGFDVPCREGWVNYLVSFTGETRMPDDESNLVIDKLGNRHLIERPTIADVIMWLYEKYHKFISVVNEPNVHRFKWVITNLSLVGYQRYIHSNKLIEMNEEETEYLHQQYFKEPTDCHEKSIEYTLTKLI